jgi:hypothetical protein
MNKLAVQIFILLLCLFSLGCSSVNLKQLGKGDIDLVADSHRLQVETLVFELMEKLYKRNPRELKKQNKASISAQQARLKNLMIQNQALLIDGEEDTAIISRGFDLDYEGDRVFQVIAGIMSMVHKSYGYRSDFYLLDKLEQQKLYNSARNFEVFAWRLRMAKDSKGTPLLLSTETQGPVVNLSFERLLGKLISLQDMMAIIAADGDRRIIKTVTQGVMRMVFLPI